LVNACSANNTTTIGICGQPNRKKKILIKKGDRSPRSAMDKSPDKAKPSPIFDAMFVGLAHAKFRRPIDTTFIEQTPGHLAKLELEDWEQVKRVRRAKLWERQESLRKVPASLRGK